jgi:hypothetical protein
MLDAYGYIDRRDQPTLAPEDRLSPLPAAYRPRLTETGCTESHRVATRPRWKQDTLFQTETLGQAQRFESFKNRYVGVGLCHYCAGQAAYGHQHGFAVIEPVRACCTRIIDRLPNPESCCWRSMDVSSAESVVRLRESLNPIRVPGHGHTRPTEAHEAAEEAA